MQYLSGLYTEDDLVQESAPVSDEAPMTGRTAAGAAARPVTPSRPPLPYQKQTAETSGPGSEYWLP